MSDIDRFRLPESTESLVVLRGHADVGPKAAMVLGALLALASLYPLYYIVAVRFEPGALGALAGALIVGIAIIGWAVVRRAKPERRTYVDLAERRLWTRNLDETTEPLAFTDLGPLKAGKVSSYDARTRSSRSVLAITLSKHPDYVLYVPWSNGDTVGFATALRALVGEEHIPRAAPKGR